MTIDAILFDKDGTLINFDATFGPATCNVISDLAKGDKALATRLADLALFDVSTSALNPRSFLIAGSLRDIALGWHPTLNNRSVDELENEIDALYIKHSLNSLAPFPFLASTIAALQQIGVGLGVATNDSEAGALGHLAKLEMTEKFTFIAGYDSGYGAKPGPGMVAAFADHLGLPTKRIAMVGDTLHDCEAGRAAGAITIGVTSGRWDADYLRPHCDYVLPDISGLPDLVTSLRSNPT